MTSHALLFTDVVDSTGLVERLGDARAAEVWAEHDRRARELVARYGGREIDRTDGFFLLFNEVGEAVRCALGYHEALAELGLSARAGVHVGAVNLRENAPEDVARGAKPLEVEGLAKPFAARIMALARGGQTLLSAAAQNALGGALPEGTELESHGHYRLKGVERPVELFELGVRGTAPFAPPADAEKAYRVVRAGDLWRPLREVRHNLPAERDAFVGRSVELWSLAQRLDAGARLLSVLGSAGSGKTRVVRRYGWTWLGDWPGGVYFCDLSEAKSLEGILYAVASALEVPLGKDDPVVQLGHAIAGRGHCAIILDNFEQVVAHASATLGRWLDRAFDAAFVVTSRERLHLSGEELFPIEPLSLERDAIDLFVTRAHAQRPDFTLNDNNRSAVTEVVRLLDGLPLAIELAAARIQVLSPHQLVERLKDRFTLLVGARGMAARQATLRAAIDWSWDLLSPWQQAALAQCSVFEGGFTLEAAEAVLELSAWPEAPPALDVVQALVEKSLLRSWIRAEQGRYAIDEPYFGMYVSVREYAQEKLGAAGTDAERRTEERHGRYFARFGTDDAIDALSRHGGVKRRRALELELDNLVAACRRAVARNDAQIAVAAYRGMWAVLGPKGPYAIAIDLGRQVQALDQTAASLRAAALVAYAGALRAVGRIDEAACQVTHALALARESHDRRREGILLGYVGQMHWALGRVEEARHCFEGALAIHVEAGNRFGEGQILGMLGNLDDDQGRPDEARAHHEAALAIVREVGNGLDEAMWLNNLGLHHYEQGNVDAAQEHYVLALALARELEYRAVEGLALMNLGMLHRDQGRIEEAHAYYRSALTVGRELGDLRMQGYVLGNLGDMNVDEDKIPAAFENYRAALSLHRDVGNSREEGVVLASLGDLHERQQRVGEARADYEAALAIHRAVQNPHGEGITLGSLGRLLAGEGRIGDARAACRQGERLLRQFGHKLDLARLLCVRARIEHAAKEPDAARRTLTEAETLAAAVGAGPDSAIGREIADLRAALA